MKTEQNESVIHNGFLRIHIKMEKFYTFSNVNSFCYYIWKHDGTFLNRFVEIVLASLVVHFVFLLDVT